MPKNIYKEDEIKWLSINYPDKPKEYILNYFNNAHPWGSIQQVCAKHNIKRNRNNPRIDNPESIIGNRYGRLVVRTYIGVDDKSKRHMYLCDCDCGNKNIKAERNALITNGKQSCGCLHRECIVSLNKKMMVGKYNKHIAKLYSSYRSSAIARNYSFELSKDVFSETIRKPCYYCGCEPSNTHKDHIYGEFKYNGIDRVDNSIGYIESNIVPCCKRCNRAKGMMSINEFHDWIVKVATNFGLIMGERNDIQ